jgi:uncharacterized repeat protein (TIGR03847 family)
MSRERFGFTSPERFAIGTVGVPGERQFYLQIKEGVRVMTLALEKSQAAALSQRAQELLREIGESRGQSISDSSPLESPIEAEFIIGVMSLTWRPETGRITFEAQGISSDNEIEILEDLVSDDTDGAPPIVTAILSPALLRGFIRRTDQVVSAGRQPCIFCGGPINPGGHLCPRANGHLRRP